MFSELSSHNQKFIVTQRRRTRTVFFLVYFYHRNIINNTRRKGKKRLCELCWKRAKLITLLHIYRSVALALIHDSEIKRVQ